MLSGAMSQVERLLALSSVCLAKERKLEEFNRVAWEGPDPRSKHKVGRKGTPPLILHLRHLMLMSAAKATVISNVKGSYPPYNPGTWNIQWLHHVLKQMKKTKKQRSVLTVWEKTVDPGHMRETKAVSVHRLIFLRFSKTQDDYSTLP